MSTSNARRLHGRQNLLDLKAALYKNLLFPGRDEFSLSALNLPSSPCRYCIVIIEAMSIAAKFEYYQSYRDEFKISTSLLDELRIKIKE
jgi:hypothetical protein